MKSFRESEGRSVSAAQTREYCTDLSPAKVLPKVEWIQSDGMPVSRRLSITIQEEIYCTISKLVHAFVLLLLPPCIPLDYFSSQDDVLLHGILTSLS